MTFEFVIAVATIVLAGVLVTSIGGLVLMYRQVGQLHQAIRGLTDTLTAMEARTTIARGETREDIARVHLRIDDLVKRPTA